jgi:hypothetical protein
MASIWKLNGADIYVSEYSQGIDPQIAEINPIDSSNSTYHYIFTPDDEVTIEGIVVGSGTLATIEAGVKSLVTLISDLIPGGETLLFQNYSSRREMTVCQLIDMTKPTTAPVYTVTATLRR